MKRVSIKDIAEKVGVSTALVSYVMNGLEKEKRVGAGVVERIREAARELNYSPNQIARSLRKGSTRTIGLIVTDIANPFFGNMARVIEDEAGKLGYTVIFGSSDEDSDKMRRLLDTLIYRQVDGFIIVPAENSENQIRNLLERHIPVVLVDRYFEEVETSYVVLDNFEASYFAVNRLIRKGYRRIGMVAYHSSLVHMKERVRGYEAAMTENGLEKNIRIGRVSYNAVKADSEVILADFMKGEDRIEALFMATNSISLSCLYYINRNGIRVPDELTLIGFDGNEAFDFFYYPLSFVEQPVADIGRKAVQILAAQMEGSTETTRIIVNNELIVRD